MGKKDKKKDLKKRHNILSQTCDYISPFLENCGSLFKLWFEFWVSSQAKERKTNQIQNEPIISDV